MATQGPGQSSEGPSVDRDGIEVIDPTRNVLDLVSAAIQRQDDLRNTETKHRDQLGQVRHESIHELISLRADYEQKLRQAESGRIDAIRAVDVGNVQRAAEVQAAQASALAAQVTAIAETLRNQVAAAATASDTALKATLEPIVKDIADLRRAQYEAQGQKAQVVETRATGSYAMALIGAFGGLILLGIAIVGFIVANKP